MLGGVLITVLFTLFLVGCFGDRVQAWRERQAVQLYLDARDLYRLARRRGDYEAAATQLDRMIAVERRLYGRVVRAYQLLTSLVVPAAAAAVPAPVVPAGCEA